MPPCSRYVPYIGIRAIFPGDFFGRSFLTLERKGRAGQVLGYLMALELAVIAVGVWAIYAVVWKMYMRGPFS